MAIKTIQVGAEGPEAEPFREALFRDARAAGRLSHPGIVTIFHMGRDQDAVFVAMEYIDGPTLAAWRALRLAIGARSSHCYVKLLKRWITPTAYLSSTATSNAANILVARNGQPKITDFGLAKLATAASSRSGARMGTPRYISPEQIRGGLVDGRSDQISSQAEFPRDFLMRNDFSGANVFASSHDCRGVGFGHRLVIGRRGQGCPISLTERKNSKNRFAVGSSSSEIRSTRS